MNLIEISRLIDKSKDNENTVDTEAFSTEFNYDFDYVNQDRLRAYWIGNWYCTDSYVGWKMYFLDDVPVAVSSQMGRKSDEEFEWFGEEVALKVREYLISIMEVKEEEKLNINLLDLEKDVGDSYKIHFNSQVLDWGKAFYRDEPINFLERIRENPDWGIDKKLKAKLINGEKMILDINDLDFKYSLIDL